jgi:hypothetical protein
MADVTVEIHGCKVSLHDMDRTAGELVPMALVALRHIQVDWREVNYGPCQDESVNLAEDID